MKLKYLFSTALLVPIIACSATDTVSGTNTDKLANINTYGCKNLHKVTDIDDLLKQMYDNIDSHCLFEMDTDDLERVWKIRILSTNKSHTITDIDEYGKNGDGLFLYKSDYEGIEDDSFVIYSAYKSKGKYVSWGNSSLSKGKLPYHLPKPITEECRPIHDTIILDDRFKGTDYQEYTCYNWRNVDNSINKPYLYFPIRNQPRATIILFYPKCSICSN